MPFPWLCLHLEKGFFYLTTSGVGVQVDGPYSLNFVCNIHTNWAPHQSAYSRRGIYIMLRHMQCNNRDTIYVLRKYLENYFLVAHICCKTPTYPAEHLNIQGLIHTQLCTSGSFASFNRWNKACLNIEANKLCFWIDIFADRMSILYRLL